MDSWGALDCASGPGARTENFSRDPSSRHLAHPHSPFTLNSLIVELPVMPSISPISIAITMPLTFGMTIAMGGNACTSLLVARSVQIIKILI